MVIHFFIYIPRSVSTAKIFADDSQTKSSRMVLLPTFFTFTFSLFQEDHYVASDFLHVLDLMKKEKDKLKQKVEIVTSDFQMKYHDNSSIHTIETKMFLCMLILVTTPNVYFPPRWT